MSLWTQGKNDLLVIMKQTLYTRQQSYLPFPSNIVDPLQTIEDWREDSVPS